MKQYFRCLALVALVAFLASAFNAPPKATANQQLTPQPIGEKAAVAVSTPAVAPAPEQVVAPPPIAPKPVTYPVGCENYLPLLQKYDWNINVAVAVIQAESSCNPNQDTVHDGHPSCMGSRGLFQIGCDSTDDYAGMFSPEANIAQAYRLYSRRGWQPWSFTTCRYRVRCY